MSCGIHLVSNNIPGYESSEGRCLPCWGASGRAAAASSYSCCGDHKPFLQVKVLSMKSPVYASKRVSLSCNASSSSQRRIPDFSRQDTHGFSRASKKQNQESAENLEESEMLSSKNGPLLSLASSPKFQATATPGPREKEIVELFRKVQAQLRERAAIKENKNEALHRQGRESETVDDLLKLLRKHSVEQGKRRSNGGSRDFSVDQSERNTLCGEDQNTSFFDSNSIVRDEERELNAGFIRPASNFQRKSPVSRVKYQHIYSTKSGISLNSSSKSLWRRKVSMAKPLPEPKPEPETHPKLEPESFFPDGQGVMNVMSEPELETLREPEPEPFFLDGQEVMNVMSEPEPETQREPEPEPFFPDGQEVMNVMSESEASDIDEAYDNETVEEPSSTEDRDCSALKLSELRVLAKSRGVKGYSKLKKRELLGLLSGDTA